VDEHLVAPILQRWICNLWSWPAQRVIAAHLRANSLASANLLAIGSAIQQEKERTIQRFAAIPPGLTFGNSRAHD
jgi:hypothetical protein